MLTIAPPLFCCIICLPAHLQPRNTPLRLMPITVFHPLMEMSSGLARKDAPALFTMMSSRPHSDTARSTMPLTWSSCRTSTATANVRRPRLVISLATGSRCSSLREHSATSAPARANSIAIDFPMPVPPPVTMAVLPSSENGDLAMAGTILQRCGRVYGLRLGLRLRDLGLALRHLALDLPPHPHRRERHAVVASALLQLVEQAARLLQPLARRLRRAPHVVVTGLLRLDPRLLDVRPKRHDAIDLAVEICVPLVGRREMRARRAQDRVEMLGQRVDLLQVILNTRQHLGGRLRAGADVAEGADERKHSRGERDEPARTHRVQYKRSADGEPTSAPPQPRD